MNHELGPFFKILSSYGQRPALAHREAGEWTELSYNQLVLSSKQLGSYLIDSGIKPGDKVALISDSKYQYMISLFGVLLSGATAVPVDAKLTVAEMDSILGHAGIKGIIYSSTYKSHAFSLKNSLKEKPFTLSLENTYDEDEVGFMNQLSSCSTLEDYPARLEGQASLLVYTSGTTSKPKGVMIGWESLFFEASSIQKATGFKEERLLSILPINHLFELSGGIMTALYIGGTVNFANTILATELLGMFKQRRITMMLAVPMVLELFQKSIQRKVATQPKLAQFIFNNVLRFSKFIPSFIKNKIFKNIQTVFGPDFKGFISGGAKLNTSTYDFFTRLGYECLQGYGLTETAPVVAVNGVGLDKRGSIGQALPGVEVKLLKQNENATEGVLMVKGPNVMMGYYKNTALTEDVLGTDGWFNTGDIAEIDNKGFITITGRQKDLIVLDGGKKVHPEEIEQLFLLEDDIAEICVTPVIRDENGMMRERVAALIVPSEELIESGRCRKEIEKEVKALFNSYREKVAGYKWPSFVIVDFEKLERTTTQKIRRNIIQERVLNFL